MKKGMLFGLAIVALVAGLTFLAVGQAAAVDTTLHDGFKFDPPSLPDPDPTRWVSGSGFEDIVGNDLLELDPGQSIISVAPAYQFSPGAFALAKVRLPLQNDGDFRNDLRFGFNIEAFSNTPANKIGAFFNSSNGDLRARVFNDGVSDFNQIVIDEADADNDYHCLKIYWVSDEKVEFYVDGVLKATYQYNGTTNITKIPGPATVGLLNGAAGGDPMVVDWVFVTPQKVNLTYDDFAGATGILFDLDSYNVFTYNPAWLLPLNSTVVTEFTQQDGFLFGSAVHTFSSANQSIMQFILNEGREVEIDPPGFFDEFITPQNPPHSTGAIVYGEFKTILASCGSTLNALGVDIISVKPKKKGGGVLNVHTDTIYTDTDAEPDEAFTLRTNILIHVPK